MKQVAAALLVLVSLFFGLTVLRWILQTCNATQKETDVLRRPTADSGIVIPAYQWVLCQVQIIGFLLGFAAVIARYDVLLSVISLSGCIFASCCYWHHPQRRSNKRFSLSQSMARQTIQQLTKDCLFAFAMMLPLACDLLTIGNPQIWRSPVLLLTAVLGVIGLYGRFRCEKALIAEFNASNS